MIEKHLHHSKTGEQLPAKSSVRLTGYVHALSVRPFLRDDADPDAPDDPPDWHVLATCLPCGNPMDREDTPDIITFTCDDCGGTASVDRLDIGA